MYFIFYFKIVKHIDSILVDTSFVRFFFYVNISIFNLDKKQKSLN